MTISPETTAYQELMTALVTRRPPKTTAEDEKIVLAALRKHTREVQDLGFMLPCPSCDGTGHVCENHRDRPWGDISVAVDACTCGAGAPCPRCCDPMPQDGKHSIIEAFTPRRSAREEVDAMVEEWGVRGTVLHFMTTLSCLPATEMERLLGMLEVGRPPHEREGLIYNLEKENTTLTGYVEIANEAATTAQRSWAAQGERVKHLEAVQERLVRGLACAFDVDPAEVLADAEALVREESKAIDKIK
jgi:hypothetical protein